jgi:hypothetical protein
MANTVFLTSSWHAPPVCCSCRAVAAAHTPCAILRSFALQAGQRRLPVGNLKVAYKERKSSPISGIDAYVAFKTWLREYTNKMTENSEAAKIFFSMTDGPARNDVEEVVLEVLRTAMKNYQGRELGDDGFSRGSNHRGTGRRSVMLCGGVASDKGLSGVGTHHPCGQHCQGSSMTVPLPSMCRLCGSLLVCVWVVMGVGAVCLPSGAVPCHSVWRQKVYVHLAEYGGHAHHHRVRENRGAAEAKLMRCFRVPP